MPISRLAECVRETLAEADAGGLPYFVVGHVGDGNFHVGYLIDPALPDERVAAERLSERLVQRAIAMEGTCTGEHGIGLHKMGFLIDEAGAGAVDTDASDQAHARSEEHHEPGQDLQPVSVTRSAPAMTSASSRRPSR